MLLSEWFIMYEESIDIKKLSSLYSTFKTKRDLERLLLRCGLDHVSGDPRSYIDSLLHKHFHNECVVKSAFVDKVLIRRSSCNVAAFEVPVGASRVDICEVGRNSTGYEIKTGFDTFARLETQMRDYLDVFDYTYLIVPEGRSEEAATVVPRECGILSYTPYRSSLTFHIRRSASYCTAKNPLKQLNSLSNTEIRTLTDADRYLNRDELISGVLERYSGKRINSLFRLAVKERYRDRWNYLKTHIDEIYSIDYEWFFSNNVEPSIMYQ